MAEKKEFDLEALKAQIKAELEAEYNAKRNLEESKKKPSEARRKQHEYDNERVPIRLFKDGKEYKDDVFVAVNGENCVIKRGEEVMVKRKFANVLEQSMKQQAEANEYAYQMQMAYVNAAPRLN